MDKKGQLRAKSLLFGSLAWLCHVPDLSNLYYLVIKSFLTLFLGGVLYTLCLCAWGSECSDWEQTAHAPGCQTLRDWGKWPLVSARGGWQGHVCSRCSTGSGYGHTCECMCTGMHVEPCCWLDLGHGAAAASPFSGCHIWPNIFP